MRARTGTRVRRVDPSELTARQVEVLRLLERGQTNAEVAVELGITLDGAKFHVSEIMAKLGVSTREEAVEAWRARERSARSPAIVKWLVVGLGGSLAVVAVVVVLGLVSGGSTGERAASPSPATSGSTVAAESPSATSAAAPSTLAACPDVPPAVRDPRSIVDWVPFVQFNGTMYLKSAQPATAIPTAAFGRVARHIFDTNVGPGQFVDCDSTSLQAGTVLYAVEGFDPRFRIATLDGQLYQADSSRTATVGADLFDISGKIVRIDVSWTGEMETRSGALTDPATLRQVEDAVLAAPYVPGSNVSPDGFAVTFTFVDGTQYAAGFNSRSGHMRANLVLTPAIVAVLIAVAPPP